MTNERAIELLNRISDSQFDGIHGDERREALSMAVRALSGDWDTIYRKAAIVDALEGVDWYHINEATGKLVHGSTSDMESWYKVDDVRKAIEKLPSAQRKTGKWVSNGVEAFGVVEYWVCDQCLDQSKYRTNFCPSCGADMRGKNNGKTT